MKAHSPDTVTMQCPAATQNASLVRSVAATLAVRADLTLDQVEDVRLAVDEAFSYLVTHASTDSVITCNLGTDRRRFSAEMSCTTTAMTTPDPDPFSWMVLTALVPDVAFDLHNGTLTLTWTFAADHSVTA